MDRELDGGREEDENEKRGVKEKDKRRRNKKHQSNLRRSLAISK
jgi:hypothetical protein